ncbi:hypothetical protein LZD49_07210 [Dyadobacter sp. CY261]|uniref:hypothetical protein n=1 Tax=Dyadobacter sp. CY261 TaxID=2907203 RepID=UPI001F2029A7|nr:hypothetical protein [Dyadobacter sp. CY261]MCF0070254.1 hypothetical protein [Dyadobacter sp. CY261]
MWNSNPQVFPELTEKEREFAIEDAIARARKEKGQRLFNLAYKAKVERERVFPSFDAKSFKDLLLRLGQTRAIERKWKFPFAIDEDNEKVVKLLCLYFTRDERFEQQSPEFSLWKGIALVGDTGVGKTSLMQLCAKNPHACYAQYDCKTIADQYAEHGPEVIDKYIADFEIKNSDEHFGQKVIGRLFDDLGTEATAKHFGNEKNVMGDIIEGRYQGGWHNLTHITSNHTLEEIHTMYGKRVSDRLREMCNIIEFPETAKSRRR